MPLYTPVDEREAAFTTFIGGRSLPIQDIAFKLIDLCPEVELSAIRASIRKNLADDHKSAFLLDVLVLLTRLVQERKLSGQFAYALFSTQVMSFPQTYDSKLKGLAPNAYTLQNVIGRVIKAKDNARSLHSPHLTRRDHKAQLIAFLDAHQEEKEVADLSDARSRLSQTITDYLTSKRADRSIETFLTFLSQDNPRALELVTQFRAIEKIGEPQKYCHHLMRLVLQLVREKIITAEAALSIVKTNFTFPEQFKLDDKPSTLLAQCETRFTKKEDYQQKYYTPYRHVIAELDAHRIRQATTTPTGEEEKASLDSIVTQESFAQAAFRMHCLGISMQSPAALLMILDAIQRTKMPTAQFSPLITALNGADYDPTPQCTFNLLSFLEMISAATYKRERGHLTTGEETLVRSTLLAQTGGNASLAETWTRDCTVKGMVLTFLLGLNFLSEQEITALGKVKGSRDRLGYKEAVTAYLYPAPDGGGHDFNTANLQTHCTKDGDPIGSFMKVQRGTVATSDSRGARGSFVDARARANTSGGDTAALMKGAIMSGSVFRGDARTSTASRRNDAQTLQDRSTYFASPLSTAPSAGS